MKTTTSNTPSTEVRVPSKPSLVRTFAAKLGVDADKLMSTLKDTAFRQPYKDGKPGAEVTEAQMMALLVVANEYGLNPFLKEIYAFPAKGGGIVPIIGIDGWIRIMNSRPEFKSQEFAYPDDSVSKDDYYVECTIERHDRTKPTIVREYLSECYRDTDPWKSHPRRMTRHKALIQCARVAFGFGGVYDPDEAERIADAMAIEVVPERNTKPVTRQPQARQIQQDARQTEPAQAAAQAETVDLATGEVKRESLADANLQPPDEEEAGARG